MTMVMIAGEAVYQCNRCKTLIDVPALGRGTNPYMATEHYCPVCAKTVLQEERQRSETRGEK